MKAIKRFLTLFILIVVVMMLHLPQNVYGAENSFAFGNKSNVPLDKAWKIEFNQQIRQDGDLYQYVSVVDDKNNLNVNVLLSRGIDGKSIVVSPPKENYKNGETYTLNVKDISSKNLKVLKMPISMQFTTISSSASIINSVTNIEDNITIKSNNTYKLNPSAIGTDNQVINDVQFDYSSNNPSIVTVTDDGQITGKAEGMTIINVKAKNSISEKTKSIIVTVRNTLTTTEIAKKGNAVVYIEVQDENHKVFASGSGFIISPDGKVVTNYHVIDKAYYAEVTMSDGTKYEVDGVYDYDANKDLAILKLKNASNLPILNLGDSDIVQAGEQCVAIGSPIGLQNTVSTGIISAVLRDSPNRKGMKDFQISVPINHGSSGGALFNMSGEVIGVTYAGLETTGDLNFSIPINDVKDMLLSTNIKTLDKVATEMNPELTFGDVEQNIKDNYSSISVNGYTVKIFEVRLYQSDDAGTIFVNLMVDINNQSKYLYSLDKDIGSAKLLYEGWLRNIGQIVAKQYPNKIISGSLYYVNYSYFYPKAYPEDTNYDISSGKWQTIHENISFTDEQNKNFDFTWN